MTKFILDKRPIVERKNLKRTFKVDEAYTEVDGGDIVLTVNEKNMKLITANT